MTRSDNRVLKFGIVTVVTDSSIPTVDLAQWAEDRGFESLFMGEHSHISRRAVARRILVAPRCRSTTSTFPTRSSN